MATIALMIEPEPDPANQANVRTDALLPLFSGEGSNT